MHLLGGTVLSFSGRLLLRRQVPSWGRALAIYQLEACFIDRATSVLPKCRSPPSLHRYNSRFPCVDSLRSDGEVSGAWLLRCDVDRESPQEIHITVAGLRRAEGDFRGVRPEVSPRRDSREGSVIASSEIRRDHAGAEDAAGRAAAAQWWAGPHGAKLAALPLPPFH